MTAHSAFQFCLGACHLCTSQHPVARSLVLFSFVHKSTSQLKAAVTPKEWKAWETHKTKTLQRRRRVHAYVRQRMADPQYRQYDAGQAELLAAEHVQHDLDAGTILGTNGQPIKGFNELSDWIAYQNGQAAKAKAAAKKAATAQAAAATQDQNGE